eukprot:TRINITY_DN62244_c0_g1_i1.p1 TRINITY_DN62244_c0_g1~~TRINITY_DN62244_c0_g1_i1.p1  ORF type:complete len:319 (+),score=48.32 TRINITY_DN62244_c0_g1_i1:71-958(+)
MAAITPPLSQVFPMGVPTSSAQPAGTSAAQGYRDEEPEYLPPLRVPPPRPRTQGGPEFYGAVPKHSATFAWSELCATPGPEAALAPVPQIPMKSWYNSYVYMPEQTSHDDRQFLQRFVKGDNGEWIDVVKARRLVDAMDQQREKQMREAIEREMVLSGAGTQKTHYIDPYTGEKLIASRGKLESERALYEEYHIHQGARELMHQESLFDFDNLRLNWPFALPDRNKPISQHTYDWFDRRNMYIPNDQSCNVLELRSMFIDETELTRWWHGAPTPNPTLPGRSAAMPQPNSQEVTF